MPPTMISMPNRMVAECPSNSAYIYLTAMLYLEPTSITLFHDLREPTDRQQQPTSEPSFSRISFLN